MSSQEPTWYEILEIPFDAPAKEIRSAFLEGVKRYHPDANKSALGRDLFHKVQEAYNILGDPEKRKEYDAQIKDRVPHQKQIEYSLTFSTDSIPRMKENILLYAILEIHSVIEEEPQMYSNSRNFCLVIDRSTSMKGLRLGQIIDNVQRMVKMLSPADLVSIIVFNDKADILLTPTRVVDIHNLSEKLQGVTCAGGTEIYSGLKAAGDLLWHGGSADTTRQLILFTDGDTYGDEATCIEIAQKMHAKGIRMDIFGFGSEWNDVFLDQLAGITSGRTLYVANSEVLHQGLQDIVEANESVVVKRLTLDYRLEDRVTVESIFRLNPDGVPIEIQNPLALGDLQTHRPVKYLLSLNVSPLQESENSIDLIKGNLWYHEIGKGDTLRKTGFLMHIPVKGKTLSTNPPREIVEVLSRISVYQMQEKANGEVKSGKILNAIERLGYISTQLFKQGNPELAMQAISEANRLKTGHCYSEDGEKRLKYGTRALLAPETLRERSI